MSRLPNGDARATQIRARARSSRLLPGRDRMPAELVARNQRERIIAAIAEVVAERGYAASSVAEVVARARVSRRTFYEQFSDRRDCMLASFAELFERLGEEMERACDPESDPEAKVQAAIGRALEVLAADPPVARLLTLEILAAGQQGASDQHAAIERLASRLQVARDLGPDNGAPAANSAWAAVALIVTLIARRLVAGEPERLPDLEPELAQIALTRPPARTLNA